MQLFKNENKKKITTSELLAQINYFRTQNGNEEILYHETLIEIIEDEFEDEIKERKIHKIIDENSIINFDLTISQSKQVLIRESKPVRKAVIYFLENLEKKQNIYVSKEEEVKIDFMSAIMICDIMKFNDLSKAIIINNLIDTHRLNSTLKINYTKFLGVLYPSSKLLKKFNVEISAYKLNKILLENGFIEEKERKSKMKGVKKFKILTDKGLIYGENQISINNPNESQILYFEDKFLELIKMIEDKIKK